MQVQSTFEQYRDGGWVHYSKLPQLTVNPKQFHQDPAGLYLFPDSFETEGGWHRYPYRIHVKLKPNIKALEVSELTLDQIHDLLEKLGFQDMIGDEYLKEGREPRENQRRFWEILRQRLMSEPGRFNKMFRRLGYDAIFDDNRVIHTSEHQLIVLNPRLVEIVSVDEQKASGFEEIVQTLDFLSQKLGSLGEVKMTKPKKEKLWGDKYLKGSLEIRAEDRYIRFDITPWFVEKDSKIPESLSIRIKDSAQGSMPDRTYSQSIKFRNFKSELQKLLDPKEDIMQRIKKVFGKETVAGLLPILVPQEVGVPWPGGFDNFSGPPFGKVDYETHPMYGDPEVYLHAPSAPLKEFLRDVTPLLSAFSQKPLITFDEEMINIEIEGKGILNARHLADYEWWFEWGDQEVQEMPYDSIILIEHVEVEPEFRREGVGSKLIRALQDAAKKLKANAIFLNASPIGQEKISIQSLESFYRSQGFKVWEDNGQNKVMVLEIESQKAVADYEYSDTVGLKPTQWTSGPSAPARLAKDPWGANMGFTAKTESGKRGDWEAEGYRIELTTVAIEELCDADPECLEYYENYPDEAPTKASAFSPTGNLVGEAIVGFNGNTYQAEGLWVDENHRRKGLASAMYEKLEEHLGITLSPDPMQSEDAKKLWNQPNRSFGSQLKEDITINHSLENGVYKVKAIDKKGREIGSVWFREIPKTGELVNTSGSSDEGDLFVVKNYRRKGIASAMYRYIEAVTNKKIVPNSYLSKDGQKFWDQPNRSFGGAQGDWEAEGYEIHSFDNLQESQDFVSKHPSPFQTLFPEAIPGKFSIYSTKDGEIVGYSFFTSTPRGLVAIDSKVSEDARRKGLASAMYQAIEKLSGLKVIPSDNQTEDAKNFWNQPNRSFGSVEIPEEIQKAVTRWLNGSYDTSDIRTIAKHEWPERFKTVPKRIYRGEPLREDDLERLNRGVQTAYGLSWTTKLRTAEGFAIQNDGDYGVTYWYEPKPEEVIVNLDTVMRELNLKTQYASEQEILLSRNVSLGWDNVETILWSEHTEKAGEEIPREQWKDLAEKASQYAMAKKTLKPNKKQKVEFTTYTGDEKIPEEFVKLIPKTDALRNYINRDERIDTKITVEVDGKPAGIGTLEPPDIHGLHLGDTIVVQVFLTPRARGLGIGTKLMDRLHDFKEDTYSYWAGYVHHSPGFRQLAKKYGVRDMDDVGNYEEDDEAWQPDGSYDENYAEASAPTLSARERLTIARETLDEESDLMQFYYLADRESWEQSQMEDLKYEWERMDEEFREEVPAQLKFEGYDESNWIKRGKIDWDEVEDYWIRMRLKDLQEEAPTSQTYFEKAQIIHNPELVRFTKYPEGVLENGFEGHEPENLGLTVWGQRPGYGNLAFAFDKKNLKKKDWIEMATKYGEHIFEFTVPYAVRAYHLTDSEWQIVFDVNQVQDLKVFELPKPSRRQQMNKLKKEIESMGLSEMLSLQEKLNADDADYPQSVYDAFNKRVPIVKRQYQKMKKQLQREKAQ